MTTQEKIETLNRRKKYLKQKIDKFLGTTRTRAENAKEIEAIEWAIASANIKFKLREETTTQGE